MNNKTEPITGSVLICRKVLIMIFKSPINSLQTLHSLLFENSFSAFCRDSTGKESCCEQKLNANADHELMRAESFVENETVGSDIIVYGEKFRG